MGVIEDGLKSHESDLGSNVAKFREKLGLSQSGFAEKIKDTLGWTQTTIARVERGDRSVKAVELPALSSALRTEIPDLLARRSAQGISDLLSTSVKDTEHLAKAGAVQLKKAEARLRALRLTQTFLHDLVSLPTIPHSQRTFPEKSWTALAAAIDSNVLLGLRPKFGVRLSEQWGDVEHVLLAHLGASESQLKELSRKTRTTPAAIDEALNLVDAALSAKYPNVSFTGQALDEIPESDASEASVE